MNVLEIAPDKSAVLRGSVAHTSQNPSDNFLIPASKPFTTNVPATKSNIAHRLTLMNNDNRRFDPVNGNASIANVNVSTRAVMLHVPEPAMLCVVGLTSVVSEMICVDGATEQFVFTHAVFDKSSGNVKRFCQGGAGKDHLTRCYHNQKRGRLASCNQHTKRAGSIRVVPAEHRSRSVVQQTLRASDHGS